MSSFFKVASFLFELMNFPYFEISPPPKGSEIGTGRSHYSKHGIGKNQKS